MGSLYERLGIVQLISAAQQRGYIVGVDACGRVRIEPRPVEPIPADLARALEGRSEEIQALQNRFPCWAWAHFGRWSARAQKGRKRPIGAATPVALVREGQRR